MASRYLDTDVRPQEPRRPPGFARRIGDRVVLGVPDHMDVPDLAEAGRGHRHRTLTYIPTRITFENYVAIWTRSNFPTLIINSAVVTPDHCFDLRCRGHPRLLRGCAIRFSGRREMMMLYLVVRMFPAV